MIRKFTGAVVAALAALAGVWLMIAPFALGTQPSGAAWNTATLTEFCTGLGVTALGVGGVAAFAAAIRAELVTRGLVTVRERKPEVVSPPTSSGELAALLAPLVEALREDLDGAGRQNGSASLIGAEDKR